MLAHLGRCHQLFDMMLSWFEVCELYEVRQARRAVVRRRCALIARRRHGDNGSRHPHVGSLFVIDGREKGKRQRYASSRETCSVWTRAWPDGWGLGGVASALGVWCPVRCLPCRRPGLGQRAQAGCVPVVSATDAVDPEVRGSCTRFGGCSE